METMRFYSAREEKWNYLSHGLGVLMALVGTYVLVDKAVEADHSWGILAYSIYGFGMLVCMLSSTLYHYVKQPKTKVLLRHFDHASIYVLIAASFSPITLILLRNEGFWGWGLLTLVWLTAFLGIGLTFRPMKKNNHFKTASYVGMGLYAFVAAKPMIEVAQREEALPVLIWLLGGGIAYIFGSVIYAFAKREFMHAVFHVFVLIGLLCLMISAYCIPLI